MDNSGGIGSNHQSDAEKEPFFDLLHSTTSSASSFNHNPSHNPSTRKMEDSRGDFDFGGSDNVLPSFDFQPIRSSGVPLPRSNSASVGRMEEGRNHQASPAASYTSYEPMVRASFRATEMWFSPVRLSREPPSTNEAPVPRPQEHEKEAFEAAIVAAVERTMKKYADNLRRAVDGLTVRLSQLESSTQNLAHSLGDLRNVVVNNHGDTEGKLRSLENHILEVQRGVQLLRDRQELAETQSQLAKLQAVTKSKDASHASVPSAPSPLPEKLPQSTQAPLEKALSEGSQQQNSSIVHASSYQQPLQQLPSVPTMPSAPEQLQLPQPPQQQQQLPQLQQPSEVLPPSLHQQPPPHPPPPSQQITHPQQHSQQHPHAPPPPGQMHMQPFYLHQQQSLPQPQAPPPSTQIYGHQQEAPAYSQNPQGPPPSQSYSPDGPSYHSGSYGPPGPVSQPQRQTPQIPPSPHITQQHPMYDPSMGRTSSGQLALPPPHLPQGPSSAIYDPQSPGSGYPSSSYRVAQPLTGQLVSAPSGGGAGYPRLPVAQPLPAGGDPPGTPFVSTNRGVIDEVVEKVTQMGFSRDQVRSVVRRLTESGQAVDLNIVLDKLMNGGDGQPPPKAWFGR
ncbi:hypothetical protein R1sor_013295 [Riccia sorocarpa]|uniref:DUF1421 domain-containing protein n=1 Tax=Riccia sorocarpa TaxID=122646 RepID=A0ABD3H853_9MARC